MLFADLPAHHSLLLADLPAHQGWFSPKTTVYYIEYRVRRLREKGLPGNVKAK